MHNISVACQICRLTNKKLQTLLDCLLHFRFGLKPVKQTGLSTMVDSGKLYFFPFVVVKKMSINVHE